jgi:hypothetical protein
MNETRAKKTNMKAKRTFIRKGTCSRTFFHLLNKEFGHPKEDEEKALDPLAGGILQQGYQCGMLWGASMAAGAEAYRRADNSGQATTMAIHATQIILKSFVNRTASADCEDITNTDFSDKRSARNYMLSGRFVNCFLLAGKWAPEALIAVEEGLETNPDEPLEQSVSCASEVVRRMGGGEEEVTMVAGFAGGLGLSGNACGALAAAIWKSSFEAIRKENRKPTFSDTASLKIVDKFNETTDFKMECREICGKRFKTGGEHTEFIRSGGCEKLLKVLSQPTENEP